MATLVLVLSSCLNKPTHSCIGGNFKSIKLNFNHVNLIIKITSISTDNLVELTIIIYAMESVDSI